MAKNDNPDYPVGYKKPPSHTQFKPGKSGNPKGRPKKGKTVADVFEKELRSPVTISEGGRRRRISKLEAIAKQHVNKAAGGDARSTRMVFDATRQFQSDREDNLGSLLQEFREKNARHFAADISEIGRRMVTNETDPTNSGPPIDTAQEDS